MSVQPDEPPPPPSTKPRDALPLFDRELSWIEFNRRVLGEAQSDGVPLLERVKFLAICSNNLDEFLMIRAGEVRDLLAAYVSDAGSVRRQAAKLDAIRKRVRQLLGEMYACWSEQLVRALRKRDIRIVPVAELRRRDASAVEEYFEQTLEPVLTPIAVEARQQFPFIANLGLNLAMQLESPAGERHVVVVKLPQFSPRLVAAGEEGTFVLLEDVIRFHADRFFPGLKLRKSLVFRVIRNSDISIKEEDVQDLLKSVESELRRRERREVVWIETEDGADEQLLSMVVANTGAMAEDVYAAPGPLKLSDLMQLAADDSRPKLRDKPFNPRIPPQLASADDLFSMIRRGDILLHRPYDSFMPVVEFLHAAADDPRVVAIKQTLYRTDPGSPIIDALAKAAESGKQVTAVVELQARFDEKKNIGWARHLEDAGVQVMYGLPGLKTHCKLCLVVRREGDKLRRYVHLSTGNYSAATASVYTDLDLFTCDKHFGADAAQLMKVLTGYTAAGVQELIATLPAALSWRRFIVAPMEYQRWVIDRIGREARLSEKGKPAGIVAKMNALVDPGAIEALYRASAAGVKIELLVRGICCLVPGLPGISENITVRSVIDRFLEHSRVFRFENGGEPEIYISSGDWMPRNFTRRFEVTFPVLAPAVRKRIEEQILPIAAADDVKSWILRSDGQYERSEPGATPVRSQEAFIALARAESVRIGRYEELIRRPAKFRRRIVSLRA